MIKIFTDGSLAKLSKTDSNGRGGAAVIAVNSSDCIVYQFSEQFKDVTSQQMELQAMVWALEFAKNTNERVEIYSDSQYCTRGINEWMNKWKADNFQKKNKDRRNRSYWEKIYDSYNFKKIRPIVKWVKGHSGNKWNERVDKLAVLAGQGKKKPNIIPKKKVIMKSAPKTPLRPILTNSERLFTKSDLVALDYPKSGYKRHKLEHVMQIWLCISKMNRSLSMEITSADIRIIKMGTIVCKSDLDHSVTRTMHDVLWKYYRRHLKIDLIEQ